MIKTEQQLSEQDIRRIVQEQTIKNYRSGSPSIPPHTHNGNDNLRINQQDIIQNQKVVLFGSLTSGQQKLKFVFNPSTFIFNGFAANNSGSGSTKRATINGEAYFGDCITATAINNLDGSVVGNSSTFIQASTSLYVADTPAFQVASSSQSFVYVVDNTSAVIVQASIISWKNNTITIDVTTLSAGWVLTGAFIVI